MYKGTAQCSCGQTFYYETINVTITCPVCRKELDVNLDSFESEVPEDAITV